MSNKELSFSRQIRATVVGFAVISVILTALASWFVFQYFVRESSEERAEMVAALLVANAPSAVSLRDRDSSMALLLTMRQAKQVVCARLFDSAGTELSVYHRENDSSQSRSVHDHAASGDYVVRRPIVYAGETVGEIEVAVDSSLIGSVPILFILASVAVISLLLLTIWLAARPIEKRISHPLLALTVFTRRIRDTKDYSLRVPVSPLKEMRGLTEDFNAMLNEIEKNARAQTDKSAQLSKLAFYDQLTGAANRSLFRDQLDKCLHAYREKNTPFAIVGIDLDHFKQLNDTLGHHIGDDYLREAAKRCSAVLNPNDTLARMGGDEFIALLSGVDDYAAAVAVAEQLRKAVEAANSAHKSETITCTASIGVGLFPSDANKAPELMTKVDNAMYRAKSGGRNRVETVSEPQAATNRPQPNDPSIYR
jgi:diguanylate cyclase (GGDEF)-like protein